MRRPRQTALHHAPARARTLTLQTAQRARRARAELLVLIPLLAVTIVAYVERRQIFGLDTPVRAAAAVVLLMLGYAVARDLGRFVAPVLFRRMDPATAGTVGFLIRLVFLVLATLAALRIAGLTPRTLAVGGAITAVVVGLAAQQTLGNLFSGLVLISVRPFRVGDRVRLQSGGLAGQLEGSVASLGLLYTTFAQGEDSIMVPNNIVLSSAVVPLREPAAVDLRARLRPEVKPSLVQALLEEGISTPLRGEPRISLEEVDSDEVVVRVGATPVIDSDGPRLADEVLTALDPITRGVGDMRRDLRDFTRDEDGWVGEDRRGARVARGDEDAWVGDDRRGARVARGDEDGWARDDGRELDDARRYEDGRRYDDEPADRGGRVTQEYES